MEILEHGNPKKLDVPKIFKCFWCGCKFTADRKEYIVGTPYNDSYYYCYYCKCPECGKFAYESTE